MSLVKLSVNFLPALKIKNERSKKKKPKSKSLCSQILDCNLQYKAATEIGKGIHTNVKS
jgi:hypothetical protein